MQQTNPELINLAVQSAVRWHTTGENHRDPLLQLRKNSRMPYIFHPMAVADIVSKYTEDSEVVAAAVLHDTLEDTYIDTSAIEFVFGIRVTDLVMEVTNLVDNEGTREERVNRNIDKLSRISPEGQLIKAADSLHNTSDLFSAPRNWAIRYSKEKRALMDVLTKAPNGLRLRVMMNLNDFDNTIKELYENN